MREGEYMKCRSATLPAGPPNSYCVISTKL